MANPQKENGYTAIANEILDKLCRYRISGEEHLILWSVIRKTYGFNKKEDRISLTQFSVMTNLKKPTIQRAITKLLSKKIIVIKKDNQIGNIYMFNKNLDKWKELTKKITVIKKDNDIKGLSKKIKIVDKKDNNRYQKRGIQKTVTKDSIKRQGISRINSSSPKTNFIDLIISLFTEEYRITREIEYLVYPKDKKAVGSLLAIYKKKTDKPTSEQTLVDFKNLFKGCLALTDRWHYDKMSLTHLNSNINEIKTKVKDQKNGRNKESDPYGVKSRLSYRPDPEKAKERLEELEELYGRGN